MRDKLIKLWADNAFELTHHHHCNVIGKIPIDVLCQDLNGEHLYRPRHSLPPQHDRALPVGFPPGLGMLHDIAKKDMADLGFDVDELYLYTLYQSGLVGPTHALRESQWHFDLMRNLRDNSHQGQIPVAIGYGVSTILPTIYTTGLKSTYCLPARQTIENMDGHHVLGEATQMAGLVFQAQAGEVVRYDSLVLHRGEPNRSANNVHRVFMHIAFSPVP